MKHKLLYLLPILLVVAAGCFKTAPTTPPPPIPSGTFSGQFKLLHRHTDKVPFDSLMANITLKLNTANFNYTVTGDTSTVHAGSYGTFGLAAPYMIFNDNTYSATVTPTKTHLTGYYLYGYDGTKLQLLAYSSDTLALEYNLTKTSN